MKNEHFKWIVEVIKSCTTLDQLHSCENLIDFYFKRYDDQLDLFLLNKCVVDTSINITKQTKI